MFEQLLSDGFLDQMQGAELQCVKCNHVDIAVQYVPETLTTGPLPLYVTSDLLDRSDSLPIAKEELLVCKCKRCGYMWVQRPLDVDNEKKSSAENAKSIRKTDGKL